MAKINISSPIRERLENGARNRNRDDGIFTNGQITSLIKTRSMPDGFGQIISLAFDRLAPPV